jgi:hypothetical protein
MTVKHLTIKDSEAKDINTFTSAMLVAKFVIILCNLCIVFNTHVKYYSLNLRP